MRHLVHTASQSPGGEPHGCTFWRGLAPRHAWPLSIFIGVFVLLLIATGATQTLPSTPAPPFPAPGLMSGNKGSGTVLPDLFTGTMSHAIPIEVPPGRKGMDPGLALTYRSTQSNGWLGVGWDLEVGAIQRSTTYGVNYNGDAYAFRIAGSTVDLINIGSGEYRAKIEEAFTRFKQRTAADGRPFWEATDRTGTRYLFGQRPDSRQDHPSDANRIFTWCLDRVEDPHGNFMELQYVKDQGQVYLQHIDYTGHQTLQPTNTVQFLLESRADAPTMYTPGFGVTTAYRLKTIDIFANGKRVRKYDVEYQYSVRTSRSLLSVVRHYGHDATTQLPPMTLSWSQQSDFVTQDWSTTPYWAIDLLSDKHEVVRMGDFNGDGKTDVAHTRSRWGGWRVSLDVTNQSIPDFLTTISNGMGSTSSIAYEPSTSYSNTQLPFPVHTVSAITTQDGSGITSTTQYTYEGGYYHLAERDLRGFQSVKVTGPAGQTGERTITEIWFHQGNDPEVDANNPDAAIGSLKGKSYRVRVSNGRGQLLSETTTSYAPDDSAPYFHPPLQVDTALCDHGVCSKHTRVVYRYDPTYGNLLEEQQYGDLEDPADDRTVIRRFAPNTMAWILGLPITETVYAGLGPVTPMAATNFFYDGTTDCTVASTRRTPLQGNLTRIVRWLAGGSSPDTRMAYDDYGNLVCTRDANGHITTVAYDASATFPVTTTNPLGHQTTVQYYGVEGVPASTGLYGQVKQVTDANRATTTTQYDVFGRKTLTIAPDGAWTSAAYHQFGAGVGVQHVQTETVAGLSTWTYFDGLGRPITEQTTGPDGKVIVTQTRYDGRGAVVAQSLPAFEGEASIWKRVTYDAAGRVLRAMQPDGSRTLHCYDAWVTSALDATNHRTRITRDAWGRVVQVDEYLGTFATCTTDVGTPYATTQYHYDILGNLLAVTDARGNVTTMHYDTLGRKRGMQDPDMGTWQYAYDPAGNLLQQIDAKGQVLTMQYDALHRLTTKQYVGQQHPVVYRYDDPTPGTYRIGRLFRMQDASGATTFTYDALGRPVTTWQTVRAAPPPAPLRYRTQTRYDALGCVTAVHYPDHSVVQYTYNGPWLERVFDTDTTYATYSGYNALGQPARLAFGNGVRTEFTYSQATNPDCPAQNFRLCSLSTRRATAIYQDLHYTYDRAGNIRAIVDGVNGNQAFQYDALHRLRSATGPYGIINYAYDEIGNLLCNSQISPCSATRPNYVYPPSGPESIRPHAVLRAGANSFTYDDNGNMLSGAGRTLVYDPDNRPVRIATAQGATRLVYDGNGSRVTKTTGTTTTIYIGKLYECTAGQCIKYIFAGDQRLAMQHVESSTVQYYHADHLGSSSVVTDATGRKVQALTYYPFGQTRQDLGTADVHHKYTGQELDDSTGLYFYNARYYGPSLGRFLTPDTIVQNPYDPQSLNRYAYVRNNPLNLIDPSGHSWLSKAWRKSGAAKWWNKNRYYVWTGVLIAATGGAASWAAAAGYANAAAILGSAVVGEIGGSIAGGIAAHAAGGDVGKGMLFGAAVGGVTGAVGEGLFPGEALRSWTGLKLLGARTAEGSLYGTGYGATYGYAGGVGGAKEILQGMWKGAQYGAVTGAILGGAEWYAKGKDYRYANILPREGQRPPVYTNIAEMPKVRWHDIVGQISLTSAPANSLISIPLLHPLTVNITYNLVGVGETAYFSSPELQALARAKAKELLEKKLEEGVEKEWQF